MPAKTKNILSSRNPVLIDLALQGGGAHGAYTWGVIDRLLEEPSLLIEGISGTSAGSMNAAVLASGYLEGGPEGGKKALEEFWLRVSQAAAYSPFQRGIWDILAGRWTLDNSPRNVSGKMRQFLGGTSLEIIVS